MRRTEPSQSLRRFHDVGGVVDIATFEDADQSDDLAAIGETLPNADIDRLAQLGRREIDRAVFFGDWFDPKRRVLIHPGEWTALDGRKLVDPPITEETRLSGGTMTGWIGGQFAYAFVHPPYTLRATGPEIQALFDKIIDSMMPPYTDAAIFDWSDDRLPEVDPYFKAGLEWWGIFLFTIYVPALRRLTVIAGSSTD